MHSHCSRSYYLYMHILTLNRVCGHIHTLNLRLKGGLSLLSVAVSQASLFTGWVAHWAKVNLSAITQSTECLEWSVITCAGDRQVWLSGLLYHRYVLGRWSQTVNQWCCLGISLILHYHCDTKTGQNTCESFHCKPGPGDLCSRNKACFAVTQLGRGLCTCVSALDTRALVSL